MSQDRFDDDEPANEKERQKKATKKLEDRIDGMNEESDKKAAVRKKNDQDGQKESKGKTPPE